MQYRKFGKLDFIASTLGFGCMRLPVLDGDAGERAVNIDEEKAVKMIRYAIDKGVNYVDSAYTYNQGRSEIIIGKALEGGYREKVKVATKIPVWLAKDHQDLHRMLDEQLERLQVKSIDMYLLHMLSHMNWSMVKGLDVFRFLDEAKQQGKIINAGFSFHDGMQLFEEIVNSYNWDFCYIQLNYLDENYQAGLRGVRYANEKGLAVVVMEPLRGGNLVKNIPDEAREAMKKYDINRSPAEWGFRWVCNQPEISVVLSGMSSMEQLEENLETFGRALPNSLNEDELKVISTVKAILEKKIKVGCTQCNYCMPCPNDVFIRGIFNFYNNAYLFDKVDEALTFYDRMKKMNKSAESCMECGLCETKCPQHLPIIKHLKEAHDAFENKLRTL